MSCLQPFQSYWDVQFVSFGNSEKQGTPQLLRHWRCRWHTLGSNIPTVITTSLECCEHLHSGWYHVFWSLTAWEQKIHFHLWKKMCAGLLLVLLLVVVVVVGASLHTALKLGSNTVHPEKSEAEFPSEMSTPPTSMPVTSRPVSRPATSTTATLMPTTSMPAFSGLASTPATFTQYETSIINEIEAHILCWGEKFSALPENDSQNIALDWLLHDDQMQLKLSDSNLNQRYILALLAYEWGHNFKASVNWLSDINECKWYGVT